jgi:hypothetical protein
VWPHTVPGEINTIAECTTQIELVYTGAPKFAPKTCRKSGVDLRQHAPIRTTGQAPKNVPNPQPRPLHSRKWSGRRPGCIVPFYGCMWS